MIDIVYFSRIDVAVAMGKNIPKAADIDEFLTVRCWEHA